MKIVFFTGSGISQESGIPTFRDRFGIWTEINPEDVAHKNAWRENKSIVLDFHNRLRKMVIEAQPNPAHQFIAALERENDVLVVTQNVDDLHERSGSTKVIHLHGNLMQSRSTVNPELVYPCLKDINIGDKCEKGSQLRPNVVWFGEELNRKDYLYVQRTISTCDLLVVIGTSLEVAPANELVKVASEKVVVIDPSPSSYLSKNPSITFITKNAVNGTVALAKYLENFEKDKK